MTPHLSVTSDGSVVTIALDRPSKRNALTRDMLGAVSSTLEQLALGPIHCVILHGNGGSFSAGVDLNELGHGVSDIDIDELLATVSRAIRACPVPVIAAIEGPCMGGAVEIALACDIRVAAQGATFAVPAARLGILYRPEGIAQMMAEVGRMTAVRLMLLGERLTTEDALQAGLISHTAADGEALTVARVLAQGVAQSHLPAIRATKSVVNAVTCNESLSPFEGIRRELLESGHRLVALNSARDHIRNMEGG